ncbi:MAG: PTS sugar transporter subunit IIA [Spirochaetales bacterium]|nr:PTS sugar transporter subunit IIA [Spirochaetales bacterium]
MAIAHIIIHGQDKRFLLIARCKEGLRFTEKQNRGKDYFYSWENAEKRVLHLRTIASITSIIHNKGFEKKWLKAANEEELKKLILLSNRKRLFEPSETE